MDVLWHSILHATFSLTLILVIVLLLPSSLSLSSLSSRQAKVRELEEKCRTQTEQFNLLSKELEKFRLQAGKFDILSTEPINLCESPGSPNKSLSQLLNGLESIGKGLWNLIEPLYFKRPGLRHDYFACHGQLLEKTQCW